MNWVEKSSIEKIRRLLEIFEQERHSRVLLTLENISVVRHNPAPYTLPVIPRPLPLHVVEGEHFVIADLRCLVSGSASSSRNPVIEASSRLQVVGSISRSSAFSSGGSSSSPLAPGQRTRSSRPERLLLPAQVAGPAPRVVKVKRKRASGRRNVLMSLKVIYFQSIFLIDFYIKRLIYMQEYGITSPNCCAAGNSKESRNYSKKE